MDLGKPDYLFEDDEVNLIVGRMWRNYSPANLFLNAWVGIVVRGQTSCCEHTMITRWSGNSNREILARDAEFERWLRPRLESHPGFQILKRSMESLGLEGSYTGFGEYSGQGKCYSFCVQKSQLESLERLAQEAAGFLTPEARAAAARDFRIYIQRHYEENWKENQERLPTIDVSPYASKLLIDVDR